MRLWLLLFFYSNLNLRHIQTNCTEYYISSCLSLFLSFPLLSFICVLNVGENKARQQRNIEFDANGTLSHSRLAGMKPCSLTSRIYHRSLAVFSIFVPPICMLFSCIRTYSTYDTGKQQTAYTTMLHWRGKPSNYQIIPIQLEYDHTTNMFHTLEIWISVSPVYESLFFSLHWTDNWYFGHVSMKKAPSPSAIWHMSEVFEKTRPSFTLLCYS